MGCLGSLVILAGSSISQKPSISRSGLRRRFAPCERLLSPGAAVLDIGANVGAQTLPLARAMGNTGCVSPSSQWRSRWKSSGRTSRSTLRFTIDKMGLQETGSGDAPIRRQKTSLNDPLDQDPFIPTIEGVAKRSLQGLEFPIGKSNHSQEKDAVAETRDLRFAVYSIGIADGDFNNF
jgi:hypothetical protein